MALNRNESFLTFTTVVLAIFSIGLGKLYLSEKNEKLRQINLNAQLSGEKDDLQIQYNNMQGAKNAVEAENQNLRERNAALSGVETENRNLRERNAVLSGVETETRNLRERNVALGGEDLARLQEINNRITVLQDQIRQQLNRNIQYEVSAENINSEDVRLRRAQDLELARQEEVARLNNEIRNLHNEFLRIRLPRFRTEVWLAVYDHHNEIMQTYLNEIINEAGRLNSKANIDIRRLRQMVEQHGDNVQGALDEINRRIDQELATREVVQE